MLSEFDQIRARFAEGDRVEFSYRRQMRRGLLTRMNPKRAVVHYAGHEYSVPYETLQALSAEAEQRVERIRAVDALADELLKTHGLKRWRFEFDPSTRRAGKCCYTTRTISIAFNLAMNGSDADIRNTLLHELAHALVGRKQGHGPEWKAKVVELGGSPGRTHRMEFSSPRWKVTCENRCWTHTAQQRNSKLICRTCGSKLIYTPFVAASS